MVYDFLIFKNSFFFLSALFCYLLVMLRSMLVLVVFLEIISLIFLFNLVKFVNVYGSSILLYSMGLVACEASFALTLLVLFYSFNIELSKKFLKMV